MDDESYDDNSFLSPFILLDRSLPSTQKQDLSADSSSADRALAETNPCLSGTSFVSPQIDSSAGVSSLDFSQDV